MNISQLFQTSVDWINDVVCDVSKSIDHVFQIPRYSPTGSVIAKTKIMLLAPFQHCMKQYVTDEDMFQLMQAVYEVALKCMKKQEGSKDRVDRFFGNRCVALFGRRLPTRVFQTKLSQLFIKNPEHVCLQRGFTNFIDTKEKDRLLNALKQHKGQEISTFELTDREISTEMMIALASKKPKELTLIESATDSAIQEVVTYMKNLSSLKIDMPWNHSFTGKSLAALPVSITSLELFNIMLNSCDIEHVLHLKKLCLSYCHGALCGEELLKKIPCTVETLVFTSCDELFKAPIGSFERFTYLQELDLSYSHGVFGLDFCLPPSLVTLKIAGYRSVSASLSQQLQKLPNLKTLSLNNINVRKVGIDLRELPKTIESLSLSATDIQKEDISHLRTLSCLKELDLHGARNFEESWLDELPESLQKLNLRGVQFQDSMSGKLQRLKELQVLDLAYNRDVTGENFHLLPATLKELHVHGCYIHRKWFQLLSSCLTLSSLHITFGHLQCPRHETASDVLQYVGSSVRSLSIYNCMLNLATMKYLPVTVEHLSLVHCRVDKKTKTYLKNLVHLKEFTYSNYDKNYFLR